ncbi:hypothetical protein IMCC9480_2031 [Oxalobacteraceae bacterium IMCC9480]|nr:hypothetical protein IMCC9480_2031 [Oxalobacteraceae bacterium IMCC9480]
MILQAIPHFAGAGSARIGPSYLVGHTSQLYRIACGFEVAVVCVDNQHMLRPAHKSILPFFILLPVKHGSVK